MTKTTDTSTLSLPAWEDGFPGRLRYGQEVGAATGYRHGHRDRQITGPFGTETISLPRARVENEDGKVREWCPQPCR